ncbi:MAG: protein phosphatase 2C domain-containing protein [Neisseria sp.]|nr:protein phosphatase 2C domain-containing protein [Neisseria sp.]
MTPERLKSWQPDAAEQELEEFIRQNVNLLRYLDQCWQDFIAKRQNPDNSPSLGEEVPEYEASETAELPPPPAVFLSLSKAGDTAAGEPLENMDGMAAPEYPPGDEACDDIGHNAGEDAPRAAYDADEANQAQDWPNRCAVQPETASGEDCSDASDSGPPPSDIPTPQEAAMPILPQKPQPTPIAPVIPKPAALPNARQGEYYETGLPPGVKGLQFEPECGLTWDEARQRISGTPDINGEVAISYHREEGGILHPVRLTLYINPDPKSLWRDLPSDTNDPYYKPDDEHQQKNSPYGTLAAARVRGRSHAHIGAFCDDDFALYCDEESGLHLLAVADGAGSAANARYGSQLAVRAVAATVEALLKDEGKDYRNLTLHPADRQRQLVRSMLEQAVYQAFADQHAAAKNEQLPLKSLACTLLAVLALPQRDGSWFTAAYQVGDGAVAAWLPEAGEIYLLGEGDSGSYSGETCFLAAGEVSVESLQKRIRTCEIPTVPVLMLMTDGVSDPKFETDANLAHREKWRAFWQEISPLATDAPALTEWLRFWSPGNHDDRTLAVFTPKGGDKS